jgi:hypothetical protein
MPLQNPPVMDDMGNSRWMDWFRSITTKFNNYKTTNDVVVDSSTNGFVLQSPDGTYWRITVDNSGNITANDIGSVPPH